MATIAEKWIEEGIKKGELKGKLEKQFEVARQMKKDGMSVDKISKYTGLSVEEIKKL